MRFWFQKCNSQRAAPSCTYFVSHASLKAYGKLRIEIGLSASSTGPHLHLQKLDPFDHASRDFVVRMSRYIHQVIFSVVECVLEAGIDGVDYPEIFVAIASGFIINVYWRVTFCARVSVCKVLDKSLMPRLLFVLGLHFWAAILFYPWRVWRKWISFYFLASPLTVTTIWASCRWLVLGIISFPKLGHLLGGDSAIVPKRWYNFHPSLSRYGWTVLLIIHWIDVCILHLKKSQ